MPKTLRNRNTGRVMRVKQTGRGLNKTEKQQTARIAKRVLNTRTEKKQRAWLYPKTTYSVLQHNVPHFLFGGSNFNLSINTRFLYLT